MASAPERDRPVITASVPLSTARLTLEPLGVAHAEEMAGVLGDPGLYEFTGGSPPTADELRVRYLQQVGGHSDDGAETWLNWVLRDRATGVAVGTVQATVSGAGREVAEVAWVIGAEDQRQGYARESAVAMVTWLCENGCDLVVAHIHPEHESSKAVARALGLHPTAQVLAGEVRWERRT